MKSLHFPLLLATLILITLVSSCKENISEDLQKVQEQEDAYKANPSKETAAGYAAAATLYSSKNQKETKTEEILEKAFTFVTEQKQIVVGAGIVNELIKQFPNSKKNNSRVVELVSAMEKIGKKDASRALKYFYVQANPNDPKSIDFQASVSGMPNDPKAFLKNKAKEIFNDTDQAGLNRNASFEYVDATEAYVMVNPNDPEAGDMLFKAAEIAKTVGTFKKSLHIYDWIINNYPKSKKAPTSQFLKAFILEDNLKNIPAAKENYELFIKNYPDHHFADDAQFSLDNLGKTNEEIQKELEALQKKNAQ